jgi:nicotinamide phosphoribosyltransferase
MSKHKNIILNVDSYKTSHYLQYPPKTTRVSSYIESRGGKYDLALMFGLQMFIDEYLTTPITIEDIEEAEQIITAHGLPFNRSGWTYIVEQYGGLLPIEIQALPEGTLVPVRNAMVQVVNTDPNCPWLTSYIETALLRAIWYPTTVATVSWHCRQTIGHYLEMTADNLDGLPFKLHDFGARGATCEEAAAIGGAAHLVNFMGTDTISAILAAKRHYDAPMAGFSIPAAEHSTMTSWGKENEAQAYANMLAQFAGPDKLVAVVSDSYDLFHAIDHIWGDELFEQVKNNGGTVVIRPDSGDPVTIVCQTIERLMAKFGHQINTKGFKVLPSYIRVIQGDGVCGESIKKILAAMVERKLSADNIAFGMGAELLQKVNRDTLKFAMKTSAVEIDGGWRDVYKDPATDHGKRSKKGRQAVIINELGTMQTIAECDLGAKQNSLVTLFKNGQAINRTDFTQIRQRCQYQ